MITPQFAREFLNEHVAQINLRRHCLAVGVVMRALAIELKHEDEADLWEVAGILHDADYETTKDDTTRHTHLVIEWLAPHNPESALKNAILAHGWKYVPGNPEPKSPLEWALYTCDELTGLIVAVTLVRPEKSIKTTTVDSVMGKWKAKSFASGVDRDQVAMCEEKLGIPLPRFIEIALTAMQGISSELGL